MLRQFLIFGTGDLLFVCLVVCQFVCLVGCLSVVCLFVCVCARVHASLRVSHSFFLLSPRF